MKKAIIIYRSKKGTTEQFGREIGVLLNKKGLKTEVFSLENTENLKLEGYDYLFLGCWTKGLMVLGQHPDKEWKHLARSLEIPDSTKVNLFATYKIATGTMFPKMRRYLSLTRNQVDLQLRSRNGRLSNEAASLIDKFVN
jgi:flavodoxin